MPGGTTDIPTWQTAANVIALGGVAANLLFNIYNRWYSGRTRTRSQVLDHFNRCARQPLTNALATLGNWTDEVDLVLRKPILDPPTVIDDLSSKFHPARRHLDRLLNDLQKSDVVPGYQWLSLQHMECDRVSEALENARSANDAPARTAQLHIVLNEIRALTARLNDTMDCETAKLIK